MLGFYNYTTWLTYLGAGCGVAGIFSALEGKEALAVIFLALAGFFDLFDGKVASTKKDRTAEMKKFGIQIDSLSDIVCFCVLPSAILCMLAKKTFPDVSPYCFLPLAVFFVLAGLIRLAYFNVQEEIRQKEESGVRKMYTGIPVTLMAVSVPLFFGISLLLKIIVGDAVSEESWQTGYFIFYCLELLFFGFGFLYRGFRVRKVHGKRMLIPLLIGAAGVIGVVAAFIINKK